MTMLGRHLLQTGQLRDGIDLGEVRDVLWNYLAIDTYERLVLAQGWPLERYSRWLAHAITSALCPYLAAAGDPGYGPLPRGRRAGSGRSGQVRMGPAEERGEVGLQLCQCGQVL